MEKEPAFLYYFHKQIRVGRETPSNKGDGTVYYALINVLLHTLCNGLDTWINNNTRKKIL